MELGMIGLGRMGSNITERLLRAGHRVLVSNRSPGPVRAAVEKGAIGTASPTELARQLAPRRVVWIMLPGGSLVDDTLEQLLPLLTPGDIVVDGGNSHYRDTQRRALVLKERGLDFVDAGTSGGIWGLSEGYSMMIGGDAEAVARLTPIFQSLAPALDKGWGHVGPSGAGHFVKMVHNGIEYGMMQAYAEGFQMMRQKEEFDLDLHQVAEVWGHDSVVRSWLLELIARGLRADPSLERVRAYVAESGEGRWAAAEAIELRCPAPVMMLALAMRFRSQQKELFADKLLAIMREQFGGHEVRHVA